MNIGKFLALKVQPLSFFGLEEMERRPSKASSTDQLEKQSPRQARTGKKWCPGSGDDDDNDVLDRRCEGDVEHELQLDCYSGRKGSTAGTFSSDCDTSDR